VALSVGIDVAEEGKGLDLVALDQDRTVVSNFGRLSVHEAAVMVLRSIRPEIVCIDAPSGWALSGKSREGERQLAQLGISSFATGPDPGDHSFYQWVRVGFSVYEQLNSRYPVYRGGEPKGTSAEVFPYASSVLLAGRDRRPDEPKGVFRRQVLQDAGVATAALPTIDRVDAALCALTGVLALEGTWSALGAPAEGLILLPTKRLETGQRRSSRPSKSPAKRQSASKRKNGIGPKP
jgi:predicted nuclease with RNAse H fold